MAGKIKGMQAIIVREHEKAIFVRCMAHAVSLVIQSSVKGKTFHSHYEILNEIGVFFGSPKRNAVLDAKIAESNKKHHTAKTVCVTRWSELHHVNNDFLHMLNEIADALEDIANSDGFDKKT